MRAEGRCRRRRGEKALSRKAGEAKTACLKGEGQRHYWVRDAVTPAPGLMLRA